VAPLAFGAAGAPSGDGFQPVEVTGNPDCVTLLGVGAKDVKDDSPGDSTVSDGTLRVTYDVRNTAAGEVFDFTANQPLDGVSVKGGTPSNFYSYSLGNAADTSLHAPINPNTGDYYDLSHIS